MTCKLVAFLLAVACCVQRRPQPLIWPMVSSLRVSRTLKTLNLKPRIELFTGLASASGATVEARLPHLLEILQQVQGVSFAEGDVGVVAPCCYLNPTCPALLFSPSVSFCSGCAVQAPGVLVFGQQRALPVSGQLCPLSVKTSAEHAAG